MYIGAHHDGVWLEGPSRNHGKLKISHTGVHGSVCSKDFGKDEVGKLGHCILCK